jgi:beta-glucanase (GH16 family)
VLRVVSRRMRLALLLLPVGLLLGGCGSSPVVSGAQEIKEAQVPAAPVTGGMTFAEEFTGPFGAAPDMTRWSYDVGSVGWGNNESQFYTSGRENTALDGEGNLVITAVRTPDRSHECWNGPCEFSSGRLSTARKFTQRYGVFEARIKVPPGRGMLPAFWLIGENIPEVGWPACGEIDIMEFPGKERGSIFGSIHGPGYGRGGKYTLSDGRSFSDDFHVFTLHWGPESLAYSVDGVQYKTITPADTEGHRWAFDQPFFMVVNLAVGGKWPGYPERDAVFPQRMLVDYVHAHGWDSKPDADITAN